MVYFWVGWKGHDPSHVQLAKWNWQTRWPAQWVDQWTQRWKRTKGQPKRLQTSLFWASGPHLVQAFHVGPRVSGCWPGPHCHGSWALVPGLEEYIWMCLAAYPVTMEKSINNIHVHQNLKMWEERQVNNSNLNYEEHISMWIDDITFRSLLGVFAMHLWVTCTGTRNLIFWPTPDLRNQTAWHAQLIQPICCLQ